MNRINKVLAACPKLAVIAVMSAQSLTSTNAQDPIASRKPLSEPATVQVDRLFAHWAKPDSPGCSVGISRGGKVLYERGYGAANLELGVPISPATVFHAASVAKVFTAMSVMLLAERGKLSLDDDVRKYLPEFPEYGNKLTVRHLLSHTGGLRDVFELQALGAPSPGTRDPNDQFVHILAHQRELNFAPGSEWQYNSGGYLLLAAIVKRVSGESLRDFAAANIFRPLGMRNTLFHDDPTEVIQNRASGYSPTETGVRLAVNADAGGIVGNAGLFTTVGDLLHWADNFDIGDETQALLTKMATPTVLPGGNKAHYGLGLELGEHRGIHTVGHSGGNSGFVARIVRYQEQKLAVAVLCNRDDIYNVGELADKVADVYLPEAESKADEPRAGEDSAIVRLSAEELASKVGLYQNPLNQQLFRVFLEDGKLMAAVVGRTDAWELAAESSTRFTFLGGLVKLEFLYGANRKTQEIRVTDEESPKPFLLYRVESWAPIPGDLPVFAGDYRSAELGVTYTVDVEGSDLKIRIPGRDEVIVQPVATNTFAGSLVGIVKFLRDSRDRVSGFTVNTTGVRGLRFSRLKATPCRTVP